MSALPHTRRAASLAVAVWIAGCLCVGCAHSPSLDKLPAIQFAETRIEGSPLLAADAQAYAHFLKALASEQESEFQQAIAHYRAVLQRQPAADRARERLVRLLMAQGNIQEAFSYVQDSKVLQHFPSGHLQRYGFALLHAGEHDTPQLIADVLTSRNPKAGHFIAGAAALSQQEYGLASSHFTAAYDAGEWTRWTPLYRAWAAYLGGSPDTAVHILREALGLQPEHTVLKYFLGRLYESTGDTEQALQTYATTAKQAPGGLESMMRRILLTLDPAQKRAFDYRETQSVDTSALIAYQLIEDGNGELATDLLLSILQRDRKHPFANLILGLQAMQANRFEMARPYLATAMEKDNPYAEDAMAQFSSYWINEAGMAEVAESLAETVRSGKAADWQVAMLSRLSTRAWEPQEAVALFRELARKVPSAETAYQYALRLEVDGQRQAALRAAEDIPTRYPAHKEVLNFLGYTWAEENMHLERAYDYVVLALRARPWASHIYDSMAWVLYRKADYAAAQTWMQLAIQYSPADALLFEHYADILAARNKIPLALKMYRKALELEPAGAQADRLRKKINRLQNSKST